jgi:hypothetical protein
VASASIPVILWAAHFTLIYGFTALACARHMSAAVPWVVGVASAAALLALAAVAIPAATRVVRAAVRAAPLADFLTVGLGGLAAIAVVWEASSLVWVPACA